MSSQEDKDRANALSHGIVGAAIEVHRHLGPGLWELSYEECPCLELSLRGLSYERQVPLPIVYKGLRLECAYRMDVVVEDTVILELKAVEEVLDKHKAQVLTYLKHYKRWLGLLLNFNVDVMRDGIFRIVNG